MRGGRRVASRTRPRYRRLTAAGSALAVTLVAVLGGVGLLPTEADPLPVAHATGEGRGTRGDTGGAAAQLSAATSRSDASAPSSGQPGGRSGSASDGASAPRSSEQSGVRSGAPGGAVEPLPASSGSGRRIVFDMSEQRVWLVAEAAGADAVRRTYPVSGSVTDNLSPGSYEVYSKSENAWGIDDSGSMKYMVRFAHGPNAAIGFHDIPILDGAKVQTRAMLGTPQSHGCIRQWRPDAIALWRFAPVGTKVVVVA